MRIPRTVCVGSRSERALTIPVRAVRAFFNRVCGDRLLVRNDGCEIPTSARSSRRQSPARYRRAPDLGRVDRSARIGNGDSHVSTCEAVLIVCKSWWCLVTGAELALMAELHGRCASGRRPDIVER